MERGKDRAIDPTSGKKYVRLTNKTEPVSEP